jgi:putative transposase
LTVVNMFAVLGLVSVNDRDKDIEILVLRHQVAILERHLAERRRVSPLRTGLCWQRCCTG